MGTKVMRPVRTLCIMADFGMGPYAWLREEDEPVRSVGGVVASTGWSDFPYDLQVPAELKSDFEAWVRMFECEYNSLGFPWRAWNDRGLMLARRLKDIAGARYAVEYHYPWEDPTVDKPPPIVIVD